MHNVKLSGYRIITVHHGFEFFFLFFEYQRELPELKKKNIIRREQDKPRNGP